MRYNDIALNDKALLKGECRMARKAQKSIIILRKPYRCRMVQENSSEQRRRKN